MVSNMKPWKFVACNTVDVWMNFCTLLICLIAFSYVQFEPSELDAFHEQIQWFLLLVLFCPIFLALGHLAFVLWRKHLAKAHTHAERLQLVQRFRDVMAMASHMSNCEFTRLISAGLVDQDRRDLLEAVDVLIANVLKMQTGKQFSQRRLLQATPYVVADPKLIDKALKARGIDTPAMHDRKLLRRFAKMLQQELQQKQESDE